MKSVKLIKVANLINSKHVISIGRYNRYTTKKDREIFDSLKKEFGKIQGDELKFAKMEYISKQCCDTPECRDCLLYTLHNNINEPSWCLLRILGREITPDLSLLNDVFDYVELLTFGNSEENAHEEN